MIMAKYILIFIYLFSLCRTCSSIKITHEIHLELEPEFAYREISKENKYMFYRKQ